MTEVTPKAFVFDLDGVIRHWDPEIVASAERDHGLPKDSILSYAFQDGLLEHVVTGKITDKVWRSEVARRLLQAYPDADGVAAVAAWSMTAGEVIDGAREAITRARAVGKVALLTNATDRLNDDLRALRLHRDLDHVFNSAEIGFAKPDERVYAFVERALNLNPDEIVYIDDGAGNIQAAAERGWIALLAKPDIPLADLLAPYLPESSSS